MTPYRAQASFATRTGHPAHRDFEVNARDMEHAKGLAYRQIEPHAQGAIDLRVSMVEGLRLTRQQIADRLLAQDRARRGYGAALEDAACPHCGKTTCPQFNSDMALISPCQGGSQ